MKTFTTVLLLSLAFGSAVASEKPSLLNPEQPQPTLACPKDRTTPENLQIAQKNEKQKGTVGLIYASNVTATSVDSKTFYVSDVTFKEAAVVGRGADSYYWVPDSIATVDDLKGGKVKGIMSCCSNGGCSRCCQSGGCICYTGPNGCFCSSC